MDVTTLSEDVTMSGRKLMLSQEGPQSRCDGHNILIAIDREQNGRSIAATSSGLI